MSIPSHRLKQIKQIKDSQIDYSEIPELDRSFWKKAQVVIPQEKVPISLRLDKDVLEWFKKKGKGYQSRINAVLSAYMRAHL